MRKSDLMTGSAFNHGKLAMLRDAAKPSLKRLSFLTPEGQRIADGIAVQALRDLGQEATVGKVFPHINETPINVAETVAAFEAFDKTLPPMGSIVPTTVSHQMMEALRTADIGMPMSSKSIAAAIGADESSVAATLKRFVKVGYLRRELVKHNKHTGVYRHFRYFRVAGAQEPSINKTFRTCTRKSGAKGGYKQEDYTMAEEEPGNEYYGNMDGSEDKPLTDLRELDEVATDEPVNEYTDAVEAMIDVAMAAHETKTGSGYVSDEASKGEAGILPDRGPSKPWWIDGRRTSDNPCRSAIEPCPHQQRSPFTACAVCLGVALGEAGSDLPPRPASAFVEPAVLPVEWQIDAVARDLDSLKQRLDVIATVAKHQRSLSSATVPELLAELQKRWPTQNTSSS